MQRDRTGCRSTTLRRTLTFNTFRVHRRGPFRHASTEFEILFLSLSTAGYRSAKLIFRFCHVSVEPHILFRSVPPHFFSSVLCPGRGGTGMAMRMNTLPSPPYLPRSWAPNPCFVIPLSFHLKLICEPILLYFDVDLSCFWRIAKNFESSNSRVSS